LFKDINGDYIIIHGKETDKSGENVYDVSYLYENGKLYRYTMNLDGTVNKGDEYTGDNEFIQNTAKTLNKIENSRDARIRQRFKDVAADANYRVSIKESFDFSDSNEDINDASGKRTGNYLKWNQGFMKDIYHSGMVYYPDAILAHELLGHTWQKERKIYSEAIDPDWHPDAIYNKLSGKFDPIMDPKWVGEFYSERDAVSIENVYRSVNGLEARKGYIFPAQRTIDSDEPIRDKDNNKFMYMFPAGTSRFLKGINTYENK